MSVKNNAQGRILECPIDENFIPDSSGYGATLFDAFKRHGNKIAQVDSETESTTTYNEILLNSICVAQELTARGITSEDIVCICTYNQIHSFEPILASQVLIMRVMSLDPTLSLDDMEYMLNVGRPKIIFSVSESVEIIEKALEKINLKCDIVVFGKTKKHIPYETFLVRKGNEDQFEPKKPKDIFDTAFIYFSSGTTGKAKGLCIHHWGIMYSINFNRGYIPSDMFLFFTSPYWMTHLLFISVTYLSGGCRLICKEFNEKTFFKIVEKYKVTNVFLPPSLTFGLTENDDYKNYNLQHMKLFTTGGSVMNEVQMFKLREVFPNSVVLQLYGITENSGLITTFDIEKDEEFIWNKPKSCGKLVPGITAKVVNQDTNEILGPNCNGELLIKSKSLIKEYHNYAEHVKKCFDEDGFFHTGDLVYYDEDECFYVTGRIKDIFKYRSWHVIPGDLEKILLTHPDIKEAIVIGYPHEEDGDRAMAVLIRKPGSNITEEEILSFFNSQVIERKKLHAGVKFVESIPKTYSGKYSRLLLREKILNNEI